jgi:hypothetical protein
MASMVLVLKRSPEQELDLRRLIEEQHKPSSPQFHHWVSPDEFGRRFGPGDQNVNAVTSWLRSNGFHVDGVTRGRGTIRFSGTAAQVAQTFHTSIHKFVIDGEEHWANSSDPQIPVALFPAVSGIASLHNFGAKPQIRIKTKDAHAVRKSDSPRPLIAFKDGSHALSPADYATIYNVKPLFQRGISGHGSTVAVLADSNINVKDVIDFRNKFGLPSNAPQIIVNGPDPGNLGGDEEMEAVLDTSWSGALAPDATIDLVVSASTNTTDGVLLSELYAIDNNLADIVSESFGICESAATRAFADLIASLAEQAAAQGITYAVAAGDSGSAGCDTPSEPRATKSISVNLLASSPYTIAVGGTQFSENGSDGAYWKQGAAVSYIPESVWNESCGLGQCSQPNLFAGGGGASIFFAKPPWQTGVVGIPNDGVRDLPDISLTAATDHDAYVMCFQGSCAKDQVYEVGGTSASVQAFAGIMALVKQPAGVRQGLANYVLYQMASTEEVNDCNGSNASKMSIESCVFNDVTIGTNAVPGEFGYGTTAAYYQATVAYDLASGLGSMNVFNLVTRWSGSVPSISGPQVNLTPAILNFFGKEIGVQSAPQVVTLSNLGNKPLNFGSIAVVGSNAADFTETDNCGASIPAAGSCTMQIIYTSSTAGSESASLLITDNGSKSPQTVVLNAEQPSSCTYALSAASANFASPSDSGTVNVITQTGCAWTVSDNQTEWIHLGSIAGGTGSGSVAYAIEANFSVSSRTGAISIAGLTLSVTQSGLGAPSGPTPLHFVPVTPCRVVDTRNTRGAFGGPSLAARDTREFAVSQSSCGIPSTAQAYSMNVTVVPKEKLGYLTIWPSGAPQPLISLLNSYDGRIKANAVVVPAGSNGSINIFATDATDVVLDLNGYFVPQSDPYGLQFYPITPCRILDTRNPNGLLGGPSFIANEFRDIPVQAGPCNLPRSAQAYSLNFTVVPLGTLGYLSAWPSGQSQPYVSTLNDFEGNVVANAAIVPAGAGGEITLFTTHPTDVVIDVNGYFAPVGSGGLSLYNLNPCRVLDTRRQEDAFSGILEVNVAGSPCAVPSNAQAYVLNSTVVPQDWLGFLALWPNNESQPAASTLNSWDGSVVSNMAVVPTQNGRIDAYTSQTSDLILDIFGYFAL